jgi:hypothetical protein
MRMRLRRLGLWIRVRMVGMLFVFFSHDYSCG